MASDEKEVLVFFSFFYPSLMIHSLLILFSQLLEPRVTSRQPCYWTVNLSSQTLTERLHHTLTLWITTCLFQWYAWKKEVAEKEFEFHFKTKIKKIRVDKSKLHIVAG